MDKQFKIYSVDTKAFYTAEEAKLNSKKLVYKLAMNRMETWMYHCATRKTEEEVLTYNEYKKLLKDVEKLKKLKSEKNKNNEKLEPKEEMELKEKNKQLKIPNEKVTRTGNYKTKQEKIVEKENKVIKAKKKAKEALKENEQYIGLRKKFNELNSRLSRMLEDNDEQRELNPKVLNEINQISLFDNSLSRALNFSSDEVVEDIIIVRVYHYPVLKQLIEKGFTYTNQETGEVKEYKVFTSSAGQIRTKKVIFIEKSKWAKYEKTLMCGLTIDDLNKSKEQGCNINKFLAYLALCNSATDVWEGFDIDRAIVVEDFETLVEGTVDYIDNKTFEVTRKLMKVPIPHSDGCGMMLPTVSRKSFMARLPWVKGLMTPANYIKFCDEFRHGDYKIKDIYGKEYDLKEDNILYIFSKSQFKMYKYYDSWDQYKEYFKKYNCGANMCNLEPDTKDFRKASFNYQMWQTLTDITDEEIKSFTDEVDEFITKGYSDRKTMLNLLGADDSNKKKTWLQKSIEIYPELIRDYHIKEQLASMLNARKKEAKYGKFKIDATYTFLIPDVFAWMQWLFLGEETPKGLLKNGEVSCKLFKKSDKLLVNRSPHLYREHAVRNNIQNDMTKKWYITDGIYTSTYDLISKILQFDVDGDRALVVNDKRLIPIAERNMEGIVPLYYEMGKAKPQIINEEHIYTSLTSAFKFNNIGEFSNKLTVMWNKDEPDLTTIAQLTALNNFTIDGAKTLLVPEVPEDVAEKMKEANTPMPYFFQYAKDKDPGSVEKMNDSTMNRICRNIENIKQGTYDFSQIGKFDYRNLMFNTKQEIDNEIVEYYRELDGKKRQTLGMSDKNNKGDFENTQNIVYGNTKKLFEEKCIELGYTLTEGLDMVVKYIYGTKKNNRKGFLFDVFGEEIYNNLKHSITKPLGEYIMCDNCGKRVVKTNNRAKYCDECAKKINISKTIKNRDSV